MSLTIHILTKNNEKTIRSCLESTKLLNARISIADIGSTDNTLNICKEYSSHMIKEKNRSSARNESLSVSETDWQLWLEPWETIISGHDDILSAITQDKAAYKVYNVQGNVITKETRLWHKSCNKSFVRPIYEGLEPQTNDKLLQCTITGEPVSDFNDTIKILTEWKKSNPHVSEIDYYLAYAYASAGMYEDFMRYAEHYLFRSNDILIRYYYARALLIVRKNCQECIKHIVHCLCEQPTMAEFWCLLGDAFFKMKQFYRATAFYDNAIILGSRRLTNDTYPIEITKYKEYPEKMLNLCRQVIKASLSR